ncbi:MAG: radical SAM family heme chaperone HemW [Clostridiaceae bacterium]|nr:radical SAM family heme chaperone HemW [Clostridiaceae bacterium]
MKEVALYIHIPFCKQKCFYCDFPSYAWKEELMKDYVKALCMDIKKQCKNFKIRSLFVGGGTPSYLDKDSLRKLMETIKDMDFTENAEKSIECNPGTVDKEKLLIMKEGGINRLSFGLQTTNNNLLKSIGRIHNYDQFIENYQLARKCGFNNINVDMMFGLPNQTLNDWTESLEKIISLNPEHISAYSLIIEEGTAFYKLYNDDKLNLPREDVEREMYHNAKKILESNGYHQYEISNYAKKGRECLHNEAYWKCEEYIGIGVSASSFIDNKRIKNIDDIKMYINNIKMDKSIIEEESHNTQNDNMEEFMFMGLRMMEGVSEEKFYEKFKVSIDSIYKKIINKNIEKGLLIREGGRIYLSNLGIELSNVVMSDMILE